MKFQFHILLVLAGIFAGEAFFWMSRTVSPVVKLTLSQEELNRSDSTRLDDVRDKQDCQQEHVTWHIPQSDAAAATVLTRITRSEHGATNVLDPMSYPFFQANSPLHLQLHQNMSCFPPTGSNNDEDYVDVRCGVLVDALSLTAIGRVGATDRYTSFLQAMVQDVMVQSSGHLPFFDLFPRVLLVDDALGTGNEALLAVRGNNTDVVILVQQYGDLSSLRGIVASLNMKPKGRLVLLLQHTSGMSTLSPFEVASISPFDRTLYFNASVAFPSRRRHSPPTLLFPLLDHYDVLFTTIPFFEEVLLGLHHNHGKYSNLRSVLPTPILGDVPYVGSDLFHAGFLMYRKSKQSLTFFESCAKAFRSSRQSLDKAFDGEMQQTLIPLALVMHSVISETFSSRNLESVVGELNERITYAAVDPIHCADWRWGPDLCHRYPSRAGKKKFERLETFRCDYFR